MANIPQKSPNPTEETLSAIRDALGAGQPQPAGTAPAAPATDSDVAHGQPPAAADLFNEEAQPGGWASEEAPLRRAANDDRASVGQMLQAMRGRPARLPYDVASVAAFIWTAGGLAITYLYRGELHAAFANPRIGIAAIIGLASAIAVPVIFFYVLAHLFRRSQDLRLVAETVAEVAMRLAQPETAAREQIVTVGQAIRREVAAMGDGVERALARAAELEALVNNEVSALEHAYNDNEVRIRDLLNELTKQRETLVNQVEHVRNSIAGVHLELSHDIGSVGDLVADKVNEVAQRVTRSLTEKGEHITLALGHVGDSMIDTLTERGSTLLDRLESTSDRTTTAINTASERLSASLNFKTDRIHDEYAALAARLQEMMNTRLDQVAQGFAQKAAATIQTMAGSSQQFNDTLTETGGHMAESIAARAEAVNATLRSTGDSLARDLGQRGDDVVAKLEQSGARINDALRGNADALAQVLNSRSDAVKDMLAARLQAFDDMFNHGGTALSEKISRDASTLGSLITHHIAEFDRTVKTYGGELVERLGQRTQDVSEAMRGYLDGFDSRVSGRTGELTNTLDHRLSQFEAALGSRVSGLAKTLTDGGKEVVDAIDSRINAVAGTINTRGAEVADAISAKIGEIDQTLGARALEVANTLDNRVGRFEELLVGRAETVTNQLEARTNAAADMLHARLEELGQSIKTNSAEAERMLLGVSAEVAGSFVGKADEIAKSVSQRTNEMTTLLTDKSGGVLAAITAKGQQFATDITKATDAAMKSIGDKGFAFTRTMLDNSAEITRMINSAGENASSKVSRTLNDLQDTAQKAIEQSKTTAAATVSEMLETHNLLRADTTALFERLREANIMLQEVLSGSHANMSALENTLMVRVSELVTAMNEVTGATGDVTTRVETNIADFRAVSARAVADLGQLATQFDTHGRELASAVEQIDRSNQRTDETINERRVALDSLMTTLDIRTEDLDQRLKRFSGLLDEALESASARAREIARVVSEASAESSRTISEQFERVRENAGEERRRTADAMRAIFDQTTGDTHALFRDANERFAEAVLGMKQMAAEMQRELEATRSELHRGIFELPQETAESAAQMRRVIVDQIEALAELNRIVARHGRNLDSVEPRRPPREESSLTTVSSRSEPAPRPAPRGDVGSFAPAARRAESPTPGASQAGAARTGWLTDLLNRASREEGEPERDLPREAAREPLRGSEERTPRHSIESLDSLSVDIARMIDHDTAADLWDRYKRGERNVFTRRLYTLQGQQAFDEIRKKYRNDREFKQTVDRYIGEFERLLDEVSRDDRGQVVARTYLTSETGKVYTMLAHAAGRFD
jgi:gas vesicle protein/flagellar biosynthesis/type III secretory pathway chaperone